MRRETRDTFLDWLAAWWEFQRFKRQHRRRIRAHDRDQRRRVRALARRKADG